jgi:hypothetical protein
MNDVTALRCPPDTITCRRARHHMLYLVFSKTHVGLIRLDGHPRGPLWAICHEVHSSRHHIVHVRF